MRLFHGLYHVDLLKSDHNHTTLARCLCYLQQMKFMQPVVYLCNIILNSVRQHNYFITQVNYVGYMFRLLISHLQAYFCQLSHKIISTHWDPIVFTSIEYIKYIYYVLADSVV